jgi:hypothetical protein
MQALKMLPQQRQGFTRMPQKRHWNIRDMA